MKTTRPRLGLAVVLLALNLVGTTVGAKDRIFVDQWSPTQSELFIADADGANPRKLVAGFERDYNASISDDGEWVVFTSERHGSADIFRVRTNGMELERLTQHQAFDDQRMGGVHVGAPWVGGHLSRADERHGVGAPHTAPGVRRPGRAVP